MLAVFLNLCQCMPVRSLKSLFVLRLFSVGAVRLWGWSDTTCGGQRTPLGVSSLLVHEGPRIELRAEAWQQVSLPAASACWPGGFDYLNF